ncbi:MAG: hypothetical protein QCI38_00670 [Candidatus Thermoplasmatota archaeon]|nr:hypothetical protein [Candidatus Thermoplasmatota archaeon]
MCKLPKDGPHMAGVEMKSKTSKGNCRGAVFKSNLGYIKKKYGTQGLDYISSHMKKEGFDVDFDKITDTDWYPMSWRAAFLDAANQLFKENPDEFFALGKYAALNIARMAIFVRYTKETEKVVSEGDQNWQKHWDVGTLFVDKNVHGQTVVVLKDFDLGPHQCKYLEGYFVGAAELSGAKNVRIKESMCVSQGDEHHKFQLTWE